MNNTSTERKTMTSTMSAIDQLKVAHRATWDSGDYTDVADRYVVPLGDTALAHAGLEEGTEVLDVASGSGNAAIPAALAGARVTGLDLAPSLIEIARERSLEAGVEVEWVVGDAEALPFPDESFDAVLSVVGVQFAPRHQVVADELARVTRPGGRIVLCSWTPRGFIGQVLKTVGPRMPKPPEGASPPPLWGDEDHLLELFAGTGVELSFEQRTTPFDYETPAGFVDYLAEYYGPMLKAREKLSPEGQWDDLRADLIALCEQANVAADGFRADSEYLVAVGTRSA